MRELRLVIVCLLKEFEFKHVQKPGSNGKGEKQSTEQRVHTVPWFVQGGWWVGMRRRRRVS